MLCSLNHFGNMVASEMYCLFFLISFTAVRGFNLGRSKPLSDVVKKEPTKLSYSSYDCSSVCTSHSSSYSSLLRSAVSVLQSKAVSRKRKFMEIEEEKSFNPIKK